MNQYECLKISAGEAISVTEHVLVTLARFMAPFTPFYADWLYQEITKGSREISVHLDSWPKSNDTKNTDIIDQMKVTRDVVTKALELRQKAGIKVRQPLSLLTISEKLPNEFLDIIADEVNVKKVSVGETDISLDITITEMLRDEGIARDVIRGIQDVRKKENLSPSDKISLTVCAPESIKKVFSDFSDLITTPTQVVRVSFSRDAQTEVLQISDMQMSFSIIRE